MRFRKLNNNYIVTNDLGEYKIISETEFERLKQNKEYIFPKISEEQKLEKLKQKKHYLSKKPELHIMVVTLRCNLNCIYCHASSRCANNKEFDMSIETAKKTVDFIMGCSDNPTIEFQGGEPLLNFEVIKYIIEYAKSKNPNTNFSLVSNLMPMTDDILDYLIKNKINICTSLDGQKELHNINRKGYDETTKWVKKIREKKYMNINALVTVTKESLKYPEEIIEEYLNFDFDTIHLRPLNKLGGAEKEWDKIGYTAEQFIDFWTYAMDYILKNKKPIIARTLQIMLKKILTDSDPNYFDLRSPCGALIGQIAYNYNGDIFSCDEARMINSDLFKFGNVSCSKNKDVFESDEAKALVKSSVNEDQFCDYCAYQPYCGLCPVCNYAECNNLIINIPNSRRCKILKAQFDYIFKIIMSKKYDKIFKRYIY